MQPAFRHCPACAATPAWPEPHRLHCPACGFTFYLNAAAAVVGLVHDAQGRLLFAERGRDPGRGLLDLPGGFIDYDETAEDGLARELEEELGVRPAQLRYRGSFPNIYPYRDVTYRTLDLFFAAALPAGRAPRAHDDVAALHWLDPAAVAPERIAFASIRRGVAAFGTPAA
jgi:ADP-ribose pyrophosphatase YjhB (NUDIX family)